MRELFGIPLGSLLVGVAIAAGAAGAALGVLALRNPLLVKLGVRNIGRRRSRTALIVAGLMLGTAIIAAALVTGDTMSHTIRATATKAIGETDVIVSAKGAADDIPGDLGAATGTAYFDASAADRIAGAVAGRGLVDGVAGAIVEQAAALAPRTRQLEPSVVVFAPDARHFQGFGAIRDVRGGDEVRLDALAADEVYLNTEAADRLQVRAGDALDLYVGPRPAHVRIRAIVRYDGTGTADAAVIATLAQAQRLLGADGKIKHVLISNAPDGSVANASDRTADAIAPTVAALNLETDRVKADAIATADEVGSAFMAFFTMFGSLSIAAGILLIFLIFVMLAAERRGELGIARAVGTRRGHLVEMFVFEGAAYDVAAAIVGAVLGAAIAYGMVAVMADALGSQDRDAGLQIEFSATPRSLAIALGIGVLLTLAVVGLSAWRVSTMTIASAIRNLPEPVQIRRRRKVVLVGLAFALGALMSLSGASSGQGTPLFMGVALMLVSLVPLLRAAGVPERIAFTGSGLAIVILMLLPWRAWEAVFGELSVNFSTWIATGIMIVIGAVWTTIYNADILLPALLRAFGRGRAAPVLRLAMAYPLKSRFRTGATLAMFTLVVFMLGSGTILTESFTARFNDVDTYGGGFQVRAGTNGAAPIDDMRSALRRAPSIRAADVVAVGSQSVVAVRARQTNASRPAETYVARGLDDGFLATTTYRLGATARGYRSPREVWDAVRTRPGLAVIDSTIVPRRDNFGLNAGGLDFRVSGFVLDDGVFDPFPIELRDPQTQKATTVTVIGVLSDTVPFEMVGISTSLRTLERAFPGRARPTIHYFALRPGVDPNATARALESAFVANGLDAQSIRSVMHDALAANRTFNLLIQGFIGLGLVVGVAALGVISARATVERRQQIGILRALGFRQRMVQAWLLLESTMIAVTAIVIGMLLATAVAYDVVTDQQRQPSWSDLTLVAPWGQLAVIFAIVIVVALGATFVPAARAARIAPAEALRYE